MHPPEILEHNWPLLYIRNSTKKKTHALDDRATGKRNQPIMPFIVCLLVSQRGTVLHQLRAQAERDPVSGDFPIQPTYPPVVSGHVHVYMYVCVCMYNLHTHQWSVAVCVCMCMYVCTTYIPTSG